MEHKQNDFFHLRARSTLYLVKKKKKKLKNKSKWNQKRMGGGPTQDNGADDFCHDDSSSGYAESAPVP